MSDTKKTVILVDPPTPEPHELNTGLAWVAANIRHVTASVRVLGLANIPCSIEHGNQLLRKHVLESSPDIVGFNIHCTTYKTVLGMITRLRTYFEGLIAIGGPHTVYADQSIMEECPEADIVVLGEAERSMPRVCTQPRGQYHEIPGVIFRDGDRIVNNPVDLKNLSFEGLAHPDYRQFGIHRIRAPYPISTSRGCPFRCCFCNPFMGGKWRPRPLEEVFDELEFAVATFKINSFRIVEPVFNLREKRVIDFCNGLMERGISLPWDCGSGLRADFITDEVVAAMKAAGCTHIKIGVESLVPEVFEHINKGESVEDIKKAIDIIKKAGMPVWGSFIIGLPHDTYDRTMLNFSLSKKLRIDFTQWSLLFPYPGTAAYEWMEEHGAIYHTIETAHQGALDSAGQDCVHVACDTIDFPKEERVEAYYKINWASGNYIYSPSDSDFSKAISILKGILRYDPLGLPFHILRLLKKLKRRSALTNPEGKYYDFVKNAY